MRANVFAWYLLQMSLANFEDLLTETLYVYLYKLTAYFFMKNYYG